MPILTPPDFASLTVVLPEFGPYILLISLYSRSCPSTTTMFTKVNVNLYSNHKQYALVDSPHLLPLNSLIAFCIKLYPFVSSSPHVSIIKPAFLTRRSHVSKNASYCFRWWYTAVPYQVDLFLDASDTPLPGCQYCEGTWPYWRWD